jgi:hypothetical protein
MSSSAQFGLCLSCGAPFLPETKDLSFFNLRGNLSVLYLNEEFMQNPALQRRYQKPVFCNKEQACHIFHDAKHQTAIIHMSQHHTGDSALAWMHADDALPTLNGPVPFYNNETGNTDPQLAAWPRPLQEWRVDFKPMLDFFVENGVGRTHHQNLGITFPMCQSCNALMTGLSYVRFLLGIDSVGKKNTQGPLIPIDQQPILFKSADKHTKTRDNLKAYEKWSAKTGAGAKSSKHPAMNNTDIITPHVAYYLHLCLPYANVDPFPSPAARTCYIEMSWIILMIACIYNLIAQGKQYNDDQSHGQHQHYGVLDSYVSYFLWRLMIFEFKSDVKNFPMWHQKYFWDAIHMPSFNGRGEPTVGISICPSTDMSTPDFFRELCAGLMGLYNTKIRALILFMGKVRASRVPDELRDEYNFVKRYFPSHAAARALGHMAKASPFSSFHFCFE